MRGLRILSAATSLLLPEFSFAQSSLSQIEQSRQFTGLPGPSSVPTPTTTAGMPDLAPSSAPDDAFGAQVILKEQPKQTPFSAFAEVAAFFTNNVALVDRGREEDQFLVASVGAGYTRRFLQNFRFDAGLRSSLYRYAEYRELDFQSVDASTGVTWSPPQLGGAEVLTRYTFTDLTTAEGVDEFYTNHAILLGVQKVFALSRAQAIYTGVSAQWSWADPAEAARDEYVAFAGYKLQVTRRIDADLFYRYGHYVYRESDDRQDNNHTVSLNARYSVAEWLSLSASTFAGFNRSNRREFNYDVVNVGVGIQASVRF